MARALLVAIPHNFERTYFFPTFTLKINMQRGGFTYIMTNTHHTVLYTGVTSNLSQRVHEHKTKLHPKSFTARYNINKLVWYEGFHRIEEAITREKQIKAGSRQKKLDLINGQNPDWNDLLEEVEGF